MENFVFFKLVYGGYLDRVEVYYKDNVLTYKVGTKEGECEDKDILAKLDKIIAENKKDLQEYSDILQNDPKYMTIENSSSDFITLSYIGKYIDINNNSRNSCPQELIDKYKKVRNDIVNMVKELIAEYSEESMIKDMIKFFIYYILSVYQIEDVCLHIVSNEMKSVIEKFDLDKWDKYIKSKFKSIHPCYSLHLKLMKVSNDKYKDILLKAYYLVIEFNTNNCRDFDLLYLIKSDKEVSQSSYAIYYFCKDFNYLTNINMKDLSLEEQAIIKFVRAWYYYYGRGVEKNKKTAFEIWKSIEDDVDYAKLMVGECLLCGRGVEKDEKKANEYFHSLYKSNYIAAYYIADIYYEGIGVEQSYKQAFYWYEYLSKLKGDFASIFAIRKLGKMYFYGQGVKEDKEKGLELLEKYWKKDFIRIRYEEVKEILKDYYTSKKGKKLKIFKK